jgi:hypothetical protein
MGTQMKFLVSVDAASDEVNHVSSQKKSSYDVQSLMVMYIRPLDGRV